MGHVVSPKMVSGKTKKAWSPRTLWCAGRRQGLGRVPSSRRGAVCGFGPRIGRRRKTKNITVYRDDVARAGEGACHGSETFQVHLGI